MKNLDQNLEVIITKEDDHFKAETPSFPKCKGIGATEEIALEKLSVSIGNFIGRVARKQFKGILSNKNFTEIVIDPKDKTSLQHRLFPLRPEEKKKRPDLIVKFNPLSIASTKESEDSLLNEIEELLSSSDVLESSSLLTKPRPSQPLFSESPTIITERDGSIGFGIPICLN